MTPFLMTPFSMIGARIGRRHVLQAGVATLVGLPSARAQVQDLPALIRRNASPLALEAPLDSFNTPITAIERFFVRYNLPNIPTLGDLKDWSLKITGDGAEREITLRLDDLRALPMRDVVAVCQCAGNRRAMANPPVPGVQWGDGAMGCARWRGVRLRDVLLKAGVRPETVEVAMIGADSARNPDQPPYAKSLPVERAMDAGTLIALEMNGVPLPLLHGFPARIVRPGWAATYWVKHLTTLELRRKPLDTPAMTTDFRVPLGLFPVERPFASQQDGVTTALTELVVNSLITNLVDGDTVKLAGLVVQGVAWDNGSGVQSVEVSLDGGTHWKAATLGPDSGRFAFRVWRFPITGVRPGALSLVVRATGNNGQVQGERTRANPGGYFLNTMQKLSLVTTT